MLHLLNLTHGTAARLYRDTKMLSNSQGSSDI
jgi:hypothetical protein